MYRLFTYVQCLWQPYSFHAWGPEKGQSGQSVSRSAVKLLKIYYPEYALVIHSEKVATRKHVGNGPHHPGYLPIGTYTPIGSIGIRRWLLLLTFLLVPIPDWIVCGAGRFTPINWKLYVVLRAVCTNLEANLALQAQHFARVLFRWWTHVDKQIQPG